LFEFFRDFVEGDAVGDPDVGVDFALADQVDDFREIGGQGVAGGEEGEFAAVEDNPLFLLPRPAPQCILRPW
jgi:hypothetical protein